jgi:tetratricopeptide (TPR) repeat protein
MATLLACVGVLAGCQLFTDSYESAVSLDQNGKSAEAVKAYQGYLKNHANSSQAPEIYYRIAKNYEAQSDYKNALQWYGQILTAYPKTDEAVHSLLDMAAIYSSKLKDSAKAMEYDQKAFNRYMDNGQLRDAVQSLIEAQYQNALISFNQKDYKKAEAAAATIFQIYPTSLLLPATHTKVQLLVDRARRAESIAAASVDTIILSQETAFVPSDAAYFSQAAASEKSLPSPDGSHLVSRKKGSDGFYYLYIAKTPKKGKADFKRLAKTKGAHQPAWSPDGQELVYCRTVKKERMLEKVNVKTKTIQLLFSTQSPTLGVCPVFHPAGNKIAYVYEGRVCLINDGNKATYVYEGSASSGNIGATYFKQLLKTKLKLEYTAKLEWSMDGTVIRCRQNDSHGKPVDELLALDIAASSNP